MGYAWDLRISSRLYDGSGAMKMVLTKDIAAKVLQKNLSQLILQASLNQSRPQEEQSQQLTSDSISTLDMDLRLASISPKPFFQRMCLRLITRSQTN